ncbi:MAG: hypothetical protein A2076_12655 [Geobacteraceae bacterium GWC2_53_11]|nr:MAG: hypothetical protein A2076_12655 [Geobacteraceae bacterium GWC2_53_11]
MKKTLILTSLLLLVVNSAFAAGLSTHTATGVAAAVYGGVVGAAATAPTALVKFSTGVRGMVDFADNQGYLIVTKHDTGSKHFGTCNSVNNIYWQQSAAGALDPSTVTGVTSGSSASTSFVGNGWTSY